MTPATSTKPVVEIRGSETFYTVRVHLEVCYSFGRIDKDYELRRKVGTLETGVEVTQYFSLKIRHLSPDSKRSQNGFQILDWRSCDFSKAVDRTPVKTFLPNPELRAFAGLA